MKNLPEISSLPRDERGRPFEILQEVAEPYMTSLDGVEVIIWTRKDYPLVVVTGISAGGGTGEGWGITPRSWHPSRELAIAAYLSLIHI